MTTEGTVTANALAERIGIRPGKLRAFLRAEYGRMDEMKGKKWEIPMDLANQVEIRFRLLKADYEDRKNRGHPRHCICKDWPEMKLSMENETGEIWECPECARLLWQSKVSALQIRYQKEGTFSDSQLEVYQRHCDACGGLQLHVKVEEGQERCLRCARDGRGFFSQESPTGS